MGTRLEDLKPRTAKEVFPEVGRDWPSDGLGPVREILAQLPDPAGLPAHSTVVVHATGHAPVGTLARMFSRPRQVHLAIRCSALLARGFTDVRALQDASTQEWLAVGTVPGSRARQSPISPPPGIHAERG